jgi:hypothetical protein
MGGSSKKHHTLPVCWLSSKFLYQVNNPSYLIFNQIEFIHKHDLSFNFCLSGLGLKLTTSSMAHSSGTIHFTGVLITPE